jgi:hypothetical protein
MALLQKSTTEKWLYSPISTLTASKRKLVSILNSEQIKNVLQIIEKEQITTVAIYGDVNHWIGAGFMNMLADGKQFIGMASITNILFYLLQGEKSITKKLEEPIVQVLGSTNESQSLWFERNSKPLFEVMERFCKGVHYSFVVNSLQNDDKEPMLLSQSDIVNFFYKTYQIRIFYNQL